MKRVLSVTGWLVIALVICAAPPVKITGPTGPVAPYTLVELQAEGDLTGAAVLWDVTPEENVDMRELPNGKMLFVAPPGVYKFKCTIVRLKDGNTIADRQRFMVTIGTPSPTPPGPTPPNPIPPGPGPGPLPGPAPIPVDGFRVLIIEDATARTKLPTAQLNILFSKEVRDYLDSKCVLGPDGKTHDWRIWDAGVDASAEGPMWVNALKRQPSKDKLPWIIISDGKTGYEGPLPADVPKTLELLKKYAPP